MSYDIRGNSSQFFNPIIKLAENAAEVLKTIDIGASSGDHGDVLCVRNCKIVRFSFLVTEEAVSGTSVAPTVVFKKYVTPLSSSGASTLCTLTIPTGTAIGATVYKDITPAVMAVGDSIHISWTIGTGTPTGMGSWAFECIDDPEAPGNNSEMIASA